MLAFRSVVGVALIALGCANRAPYVCSSSEQCALHGNTGVCEATGFCSFPDSACGDQGRRYEPNAGDELGGTCVPAVAACGHVGEACCASESACVGGASCASGTCQACVTDVALGRRFACTLHRDSTIWCSGDNARGQLGNGIAGMPTATPTQVRDETSAVIADAIAVAAGREHACAIRAGGSVWCWGINGNGQLGTGDTAQRAAAAPVIKTDNTKLAEIVQLAPGDNQTCARDATGGVWCWGDNSSGQLGDGTPLTPPPPLRSKAAPVLVAAGGAPLGGVTNLLTGGRHLCAQKPPDEVWCWGANQNGQLGDGTTTPKTSPFKAYAATKVGLGRWHTCAVNADSTMSCWGWNGLGRLGIGTGASFDGGNQLMPAPVLEQRAGAAFQGFEAVADGGVSCAVMRDHHVTCWGDDPYGQTGTGAGSVVPVGVVLPHGRPLTDVERISAKHAHVCAFRTGGEIMCWGRNTEGTFGDGTFLNRGFPTPLRASCP